MFGERTSPEEARSSPENGRSVRRLLPALLALVIVVSLILGVRREKESTLQPPF